MKRSHRRGNPIILVAILILVLVFIVSGLQFLGSTGLFGKHQDQPINRDAITLDGKEYLPRMDLTVILLAGIDQPRPTGNQVSYNNPCEADMISLLIIDEKTEKINIISLNRDTMVDMSVLGMGGKEVGTVNAQLALAHTYGSGGRDSSANLRKAVSNFLYGLQIDYYITMTMDAVGVLNDAVGGVEVDDFSMIDPSITGPVKLNAQQAMQYVQGRRDVEDETNIARMERQKKYLKGFFQAVKAVDVVTKDYLVDTYESIQPHVVTDCSVETLESLADRFSDYSLGDVVHIPGTSVESTYMEYHVNAEECKRMVVKYLYAPRK